jgi:hypothetical protein
MHNYTITVTRRTDASAIAFPFCFEITVPLAAADVWQEWITTLTDYHKSWFWPTRYSQPTVEGGIVKKGGRMILTYQIPNPHDSSKPDKQATYEFDILDFRPEDMYFEYRATDGHPFLRGGGSLQVKPTENDVSVLTWQGEYRHDSDDPGKIAQGDVFAFFLCQFFTAAAQNVRRQTE